MICLLQRLVLLFYVQRGEGDQSQSLNSDQEPDAPRSETTPDVVRRNNDELSEVGSPGLRDIRSSPEARCQVHSIILKMGELGLGYDADEVFRFKYCRGSCPARRTNYDLAFKNMVKSGVLEPLKPGEVCEETACCRPTEYDRAIFLDNSNKVHEVRSLFADACGCVD